MSLEVKNVTKRYNRASVFSPVSFEVHSGNCLAITGANGSGKSTLLKMLSGVADPTKGSISWIISDKKLDSRSLQRNLGFVSPYLELYNELTAIEHVLFVAQLKEIRITSEEAINELVGFGLDPSIATSDRVIKQYSSGMQQRVRLAMAFISKPKILLLDEPSSNLDEEGIQILFRRIQDFINSQSLVLIATNDAREQALARKIIRLEPHSHR